MPPKVVTFDYFAHNNHMVMRTILNKYMDIEKYTIVDYFLIAL